MTPARGETEDDLDILLSGVNEIGVPGVPGPLCVYGPEAFPVVVGTTGAGLRAPVVVAGRWQDGRIVAFGHDGYFLQTELGSSDTGRFMVNALRWAARDGSHDPRIGVVNAPGLFDWLRDGGHNAVQVSLQRDSVEDVDVLAMITWNQSVPEMDVVSSFVRGGGGLVAANTGWGWAQLNPQLELSTEHAGNRLLAPAGIQWSFDWFGNTSGGVYAIDREGLDLVQIGNALDAVKDHASGGREISGLEMDQLRGILEHTTRCLPVDDTLFLPRLRALAEATGRGRGWPSESHPVGRFDVLERLDVNLFFKDHLHTPPEQVRAHPAAADFPGSVPDDAPRVSRVITINTDVPRWHSTGLYAAPGELITIVMAQEAADAGGFYVRVGAHTDRIWHKPEWTRMPEISRRFKVSTPTTLAANAFGGLIYIEVPSGLDLGSIDVEIEGAVAAPLFVLGETDLDTWRNEIRQAPAPWAEIAGRNMIVTTPSSEVRDLDDPDSVAETWDRALDLSAELAAWDSTDRTSPERFVVDRQISVGYMHSGYPIMAHMDQQANLVNVEHLRSECNWGFYHEVGHNHQEGDWTFDGTWEVTVNLFTLYVYEFLCGIPVAENYRGSASFRSSQMASYDFDNPDFEQWKQDPFLALVMYEQLQQEFGWEAFREVFASYRNLPDEMRPMDDHDKRDLWLVRFSRQVGRNLGPFFQAWGVPTSAEARESIADLPVWLPEGFPPDD